ncbi:hypothetical protein GCM10010954_23280 [Halobacillus andaensis]|uniref:Gram-positive cocci surface proteins LPxTG domain-containing protein n=1 Tax=Halobacillus andaensis TaxID=1176239 RepID=A0A917B5R7_HALAA|nr:LPXTG cell wall anchor domain-containing protein [Halobacillus andaensis]MBP2006081.1 LPXTG-motif cell wall-anchored protein [Halobacillus andaensis]GGF23770.1 hypothetical protein GCM10010954_23280 [Halobacillus andaensis]
MIKKVVPLSLAALVVAWAPAQVLAEDSASDVLQKSNEAMAELESYSSETEMEQTMTIAGEPITINSHSQQDITLDPFAMHQVITTSSPEEGEVSLESYWTEDGFYQEDPEQGWIELPSEFTEGIDDLMNAAMAEDQVAQAEELAEDMSVEDQGDSYLLTYQGDGEALKDEFQKMFESGMGEEESSMMEDMMGEMTINDLSYEMTIDKETHYMTNLMMDMDMDMEMEGESTNTVQTIDMTLDNFNGVDEITVPQEVIDEAALLEDEMMEEGMSEEGGELPDTSTNSPMLILSGVLMVGIGGLLLFRRSPKTN